ncbi:MAG TPA: hypothetical protein VGH36_11025, partial [Acetobacteraceae bacterium]
MTPGDDVQLAAFDELAQRIGARRVEEAVAHDQTAQIRRDERLRDKTRNGLHDTRPIVLAFGHHRLNRFQRERADEHGKPAENQPLHFGKQIVAPIQCGAQRLMPGCGRAAALPQQPEAVIEQCGNSLDAVCVHAAGNQFDRQRYAIELARDFGDDRCVPIAHLELAAAQGDTLNEKLHCRKSQYVGGTQTIILGRATQRRQAMNLFVLDPQRFPARRQQIDMGCLLED